MAIHAMREVFGDPSTEAVLLVDVSNALNHQVALCNMEYLCPPFYKHLYIVNAVPLFIDNCCLFLRRNYSRRYFGYSNILH